MFYSLLQIRISYMQGARFLFGWWPSNLNYYYVLCCFQIHLGPVKVMKYNHVFDAVISADAKGIIEYWTPDTLQFPENEYVFSTWFLIFLLKLHAFFFSFYLCLWYKNVLLHSVHVYIYVYVYACVCILVELHDT